MTDFSYVIEYLVNAAEVILIERMDHIQSKYPPERQEILHKVITKE
ncbi:MAG: hypothetical protein V3U88_11315 [Methylococcales bacterium]